MKLVAVFIYVFLFAVCFLVLALIWHWRMPGVYFMNRDAGPIADFLPPFVHPDASGEFFIRPKEVVYTIWAVFLGCALVIPGVCSWLLMRMYERALKKAWM